MTAPILLDGRSLGVDEVVAVARARARVALAPAAKRRIDRCRVLVEWLLARREKVYGLTTGFGKLRDVAIAPEHTRQLQENLIRSHAAGVGKPLPEDVVRAAILLRINTLCQGNSGIRSSTVQALVDLLNDDLYPFVPEQGSVGCSGDLAPLSHLMLVVMGDPEAMLHVRRGGPVIREPRTEDFEALGHAFDTATLADDAFAERMESVAVARAWPAFRPVRLAAKEGLALNNGTQVMTAIGLLTVHDTTWTLRTAEMVAAMSLEANRGVRGAFRDEIHLARPQTFQLDVARRVIGYCEGSQILDLYLNSASLRRAGRHLDEAEEALARLRSTIAAQGEQVPGPVAMLSGQLAKVREMLGEVLPTGDEAESTLATWAARTPREQIVFFELRLRPVRQRLGTIQHTVQQPNFPSEDDARRLDEALVAAMRALRDAVPTAPIVQDDYSFRCYPQVLACAWRALEHVRGILLTEANSATDNPLLFPPLPPGVSAEAFEAWSADAYRAALDADPDAPDRCRDAVIGGGNFHGEPVAIAMDYLAIAIAEAANISERRIAHLVDESLSRGLPPFLVEGSGLNSGFMIPQYTAAALVSENKILCHPASVDSIPTCANSEDHVSMGTIAARKCATILENVRQVIAIELYAAHQALGFRTPLQPGRPLRQVRAYLHHAGLVRFSDDIVMFPPLARARVLLEDPGLRALLAAV